MAMHEWPIRGGGQGTPGRGVISFHTTALAAERVPVSAGADGDADAALVFPVLPERSTVRVYIIPSPVEGVVRVSSVSVWRVGSVLSSLDSVVCVLRVNAALFGEGSGGSGITCGRRDASVSCSIFTSDPPLLSSVLVFPLLELDEGVLFLSFPFDFVFSSASESDSLAIFTRSSGFHLRPPKK